MSVTILTVAVDGGAPIVFDNSGTGTAQIKETGSLIELTVTNDTTHYWASEIDAVVGGFSYYTSGDPPYSTLTTSKWVGYDLAADGQELLVVDWTDSTYDQKTLNLQFAPGKALVGNAAAAAASPAKTRAVAGAFFTTGTFSGTAPAAKKFKAMLVPCALDGTVPPDTRDRLLGQVTVLSNKRWHFDGVGAAPKGYYRLIGYKHCHQCNNLLMNEFIKI